MPLGREGREREGGKEEAWRQEGERKGKKRRRRETKRVEGERLEEKGDLVPFMSLSSQQESRGQGWAHKLGSARQDGHMPLITTRTAGQASAATTAS